LLYNANDATFEIPGNWLDQTVVDIHSPKNDGFHLQVINNPEVSETSPSEAMKPIRDTYQSMYRPCEVLVDRAFDIKGYMAHRLEYRGEQPDGAVRGLTIIVFHKPLSSLTINCSAPTRVWGNYSKDVKKLIDSFTIRDAF